MLNGNLNCDDVKKIFLQYINFEMNKKDMGRVAKHLRNCPKCFNQYSKLQKRKKVLKKKMQNIEKILRMQSQISEYYDKESCKELNCMIETILLKDETCKKELLKNAKLTELLKKFKYTLELNKEKNNTKDVFKKIKKRKYLFNFLFLQPLRHVLLKF